MLFFFPPQLDPPLSHLSSSSPEISHAHIRMHICAAASLCMRRVWVFKYTWGLPECDPVLNGESPPGVTLCRSFVEPLPLSLRRAPLPPCLQICFIRCNKAFTQSLWCLCCFAAPLHCSPTVKACCCVSGCLQPSDTYWFHFSCRRWCACNTKDIHVMW